MTRTFEIFGKTIHRQERIVILGGGNVGLAVAKALEGRAERLRARVIEKNRVCAEPPADELERTIVLHGDGMNMDLLAEAGIDRADAILAVTDDDKTNLLASVRAKQAGSAMAIALVNDPTLVPLMEPLGSTPISIREPRQSVRSCVTSGMVVCGVSTHLVMPRPR